MYKYTCDNRISRAINKPELVKNETQIIKNSLYLV